MAKRRGLSFDIDGCLFNDQYCDDESEDKSVIDHNRPFFDVLLEENKAFEKVTIFIGSNRQSQEIDEYCTDLPMKGSCFPEMAKISDHLNAFFDDFLLADVHGKLPAGTSFMRAIDTSYEGKHCSWVMDRTKLTMLYAQIHKMASDFPEDEIVFDFYDDRGLQCRSDDDDLLEILAAFFEKFPQCLPTNTTLCLNHYAGEEATLITSIQGTGDIDRHYRQTVFDMVSLAREADDDQDQDEYSPIAAAYYVTPELLAEKRQKAEAASLLTAVTSGLTILSSPGAYDDEAAASLSAQTTPVKPHHPALHQ